MQGHFVFLLFAEIVSHIISNHTSCYIGVIITLANLLNTQITSQFYSQYNVSSIENLPIRLASC